LTILLKYLYLGLVLLVLRSPCAFCESRYRGRVAKD
jgi:hypothetical protein